MPAEHGHLELGAEHVRLQVLDRAGLAVGAIVEERSQLAVRGLEHLLGGFSDRAGLGVVKVEAVDANLIAQLSNILLLARRREHAPAARLHLPS